jgi:cobalt-precorrin 5A hydrolase
MIAAGLGCRAGCATDDILAALAAALARAERSLVDVHALYAPEFKASEKSLQVLAQRLDKPLLLLPMAALRAQQGATLSTSQHALQRYGLSSVAETAALAGACCLPGAGERPRLLVPRCIAGGATCALAIAESPT